MWKPSLSIGVGFSEHAVWSRAARRQASKGGVIDVNEDADMALGFKIYVENNINEPGIKVTIRWLKGQDSVLFESFCGMIKRKLEEAME
jgi:23S rRNA (adenine1618-N6)-methyltransferase